jgi:hypothetical protein
MKGLGQVKSAYTLGSSRTDRPARRIRKEKTMKLTWKQRFRNWLYDDDADKAVEVPSLAIEPASLDSNGMRLQIYKASGGFVVETRRYDERTDRHDNTMHVITENEDLGERLGKIVMMEALRG